MTTKQYRTILIRRLRVTRLALLIERNVESWARLDRGTYEQFHARQRRLWRLAGDDAPLVQAAIRHDDVDLERLLAAEDVA